MVFAPSSVITVILEAEFLSVEAALPFYLGALIAIAGIIIVIKQRKK